MRSTPDHKNSQGGLIQVQNVYSKLRFSKTHYHLALQDNCGLDLKDFVLEKFYYRFVVLFSMVLAMILAMK